MYNDAVRPRAMVDRIVRQVLFVHFAAGVHTREHDVGGAPAFHSEQWAAGTVSGPQLNCNLLSSLRGHGINSEERTFRGSFAPQR